MHQRIAMSKSPSDDLSIEIKGKNIFSDILTYLL